MTHHLEREEQTKRSVSMSGNVPIVSSIPLRVQINRNWLPRETKASFKKSRPESMKGLMENGTTFR